MNVELNFPLAALAAALRYIVGIVSRRIKRQSLTTPQSSANADNTPTARPAPTSAVTSHPAKLATPKSRVMVATSLTIWEFPATSGDTNESQQIPLQAGLEAYQASSLRIAKTFLEEFSSDRQA